MPTSSQKPAVTAFAETAALWAVMNENDIEARRIVADLYPNERAEFAEQLDRLRAMLTDRFGNDIASGFKPRVQVLDSEGRFIRRQTGGAR
jgi:acyl-ACP thioesterase